MTGFSLLKDYLNSKPIGSKIYKSVIFRKNFPISNLALINYINLLSHCEYLTYNGSNIIILQYIDNDLTTTKLNEIKKIIIRKNKINNLLKL